MSRRRFRIGFPTHGFPMQSAMILADQHRLDARRAELNAKNSLSAFNCFLDIVSIHIRLPCIEVFIFQLISLGGGNIIHCYPFTQSLILFA